MRSPLLAISSAVFVVVLALPAPAVHARAPATPTQGVPGIEEAHLNPEFWVGRLQAPGEVLLDTAAVSIQNHRLQELDDSVHDLGAMPRVLTRAQVTGWIESLSKRPGAARFDGDGRLVSSENLDALLDNLALPAVPPQQPTRHGLVVQRADLRTFPTAMRVFSAPGDTDLDRFQETALFPGTPVVIAHDSADGDWRFVVSPNYAAWTHARNVAEGPAAQVLGYAAKAPYRIVTGAKELTAYTPARPDVSELQLDMGVRVAVLSEHPAGERVNGQHPGMAHVVELPTRRADGTLDFTPVLLPRVADTAADYLPLTRENLIRQSFKFLGERYGWGHAHNGRDCSGFVSEIYRSMGVQLPRNTGDQATSPALDHTAFADSPGGAARAAAIAGLQVGDLVFIPGHVMMVIGHVDGDPYVIHDIHGGRHLGADGQIRELGFNGVVATPLLPLMFDARERYVDRITSVVRVRSTTTGNAPP